MVTDHDTYVLPPFKMSLTSILYIFFAIGSISKIAAPWEYVDGCAGSRPRRWYVLYMLPLIIDPLSVLFAIEFIRQEVILWINVF